METTRVNTSGSPMHREAPGRQGGGRLFYSRRERDLARGLLSAKGHGNDYLVFQPAKYFMRILGDRVLRLNEALSEVRSRGAELIPSRRGCQAAGALRGTGPAHRGDPRQAGCPDGILQQGLRGPFQGSPGGDRAGHFDRAGHTGRVRRAGRGGGAALGRVGYLRCRWQPPRPAGPDVFDALQSAPFRPRRPDRIWSRPGLRRLSAVAVLWPFPGRDRLFAQRCAAAPGGQHVVLRHVRRRRHAAGLLPGPGGQSGGGRQGPGRHHRLLPAARWRKTEPVDDTGQYNEKASCRRCRAKGVSAKGRHGFQSRLKLTECRLYEVERREKDMVDRTNIPELIAWLEMDEGRSRECRARRFSYFMEVIQVPSGTFGRFHGRISHQCYEEVRLAYIHGLYLATVLLSLSYVEHQLAGQFYEAGESWVNDATLEELLEKAHQRRMLSRSEFDTFNDLRSIRNSYVHFRHPGHPSELLNRSVDQDALPHDVIKADAERALEAFGSFHERQVP